MARSAGPARNHALAVAAGGTLALELLTLTFVEKVFVGGWLGDYALLGLGERLGLLVALLLYCLAIPGVLFAVVVPLLRLVRVPADRAVWLVGLGWLMALVGVVIVETRVGEFFQGAFDLDVIRALGGGTLTGAVKYVLTWFWVEALLALGGIAIGAWLCVRLTRWLRKVPFEATRLGRIPAGRIRLAVAGAVLFVLLDVCVLGSWWPSVAWATGETFVGSCVRIVIAEATDVDGDGVGAFDEPPDQAPFDATRHPYAVDVPADGVDSNGLCGDLRLEGLPAALRRQVESRGRAASPPRHRKNVVLVFLESFRPGLVGREENGKPVTPFLDGLIASGVALRVDPAYACIGYTAPSIRQAFWGGFARREKTLVHDLSDAGWYTATVSGQDESWSDIASDSGLVDCDFYEDSRHDDPTHVLGGVRRIHRVLRSFERFLAARPKDRPFFLYMNLQDCHFPYEAAHEDILYENLPHNPSLGRGNADELWRLYVNQAANVDRGLGRIRDRLTEEGVWKDTILLIVSDHGESIYHDGVLGHGLQLTDNQTRVACYVVHATTDVPVPFTHADVRALLGGMLAVETPVVRPKVVTPPGRHVLQVIGRVKWPRRLAHVNAEGRRVIFDFTRRLCIQTDADRTCSLDSTRPEDRDLVRRTRDLIRHWEYTRWWMEFGAP